MLEYVKAGAGPVRRYDNLYHISQVGSGYELQMAKLILCLGTYAMRLQTISIAIYILSVA